MIFYFPNVADDINLLIHATYLVIFFSLRFLSRILKIHRTAWEWEWRELLVCWEKPCRNVFFWCTPGILYVEHLGALYFKGTSIFYFPLSVSFDSLDCLQMKIFLKSKQHYAMLILYKY